MTNSNKNFLFLFSFLFVILLTASVSAAPAQKGDSAIGLDIEVPIFNEVKQYQDQKFHVHVFNETTGYPLYSSNGDEEECFIHLYKQDNGGHYIEYEMNNDSNGIDYDITILGGNFTELGQHVALIWCNNSFQGDFINYEFYVTPGSSFTLFLVLIFISIGLFLLAYLLDSDWMIFMSGILWILTGMYGMIYGIGDLTNLYTRGISGTILVIGMVFIVAAIFNIAGDREEEE